ncbi:PREDICTED: uncharacterized protein LOC106806257 [Priapulus caudatus]|uniref:Uncharacterized protein LOC106806257 n=1 Tax=Priapulus caudatus TaxID=37621 RepID=A0ABM1DUJ4_PRICU|nr:PREDICTED: uncharacterized protein LOC106806257 [Priapulus caudatus]XP_014663616.1 PREDICTED: uncharacterized protein LOC106806257 [Priapulus caudatus]XP_014663617.1 PREDICTED: uncharacterized protein LOC106806257 [Priapulus caudatus]XP_014663618.1 PREDICTED: uncharacterized protein LOC106806257 [Priapulus caudatus]XP_014663620.1 PREDICTED: uncharacterized protein LOC106806257 [Priapulus caudatus]
MAMMMALDPIGGSSVYYRCTACWECFFTVNDFSVHAQTAHCKLLICEGHNSALDEQNQHPCERSVDYSVLVQPKLEPVSDAVDEYIELQYDSDMAGGTAVDHGESLGIVEGRSNDEHVMNWLQMLSGEGTSFQAPPSLPPHEEEETEHVEASDMNPSLDAAMVNIVIPRPQPLSLKRRRKRKVVFTRHKGISHSNRANSSMLLAKKAAARKAAREEQKEAARKTAEEIVEQAVFVRQDIHPALDVDTSTCNGPDGNGQLKNCSRGHPENERKPGTYGCSLCISDNVYDGIETLFRHRFEVHGCTIPQNVLTKYEKKKLPKSKRIMCNLCRTILKSMSGFMEHKKSKMHLAAIAGIEKQMQHAESTSRLNKNWICGVCGQTFETRNVLQSHQCPISKN